MRSFQAWAEGRFAAAWLLPVGALAALWLGPWAVWAYVLGFLVCVALLERVPAWQCAPAPAGHRPWHRACLLLHVPLQVALLLLGAWLASRQPLHAAGALSVVALGLGVGGIAGSQGISFAHELGHSRRRIDRAAAWLLMGSVLYAHFMVEHYRGHHVRAATHADPASARRGESLWRFLPRTLAGSWRSAWQLQASSRRPGASAWAGPLPLAVALQALWLAGLLALLPWAGPWPLLFWLVQAGQAVWMLETVNYIEHYGLVRSTQPNGRPEPFGLAHAWNADHLVTNAVIANLERHSDHHMHPSKPYADLQALPGPQLPTGYAGCLLLASLPRCWFALMEPRLQRWQSSAG